MNSEPDCLAGVLLLLVFGMLLTVIVIVTHPTPDERQIWLSRMGKSTGIVWTQPLQ
jgi:hypothetical protein